MNGFLRRDQIPVKGFRIKRIYNQLISNSRWEMFSLNITSKIGKLCIFITRWSIFHLVGSGDKRSSSKPKSIEISRIQRLAYFLVSIVFGVVILKEGAFLLVPLVCFFLRLG
jgi:hypothetical protein